jgi:hypothetical protein
MKTTQIKIMKILDMNLRWLLNQNKSSSPNLSSIQNLQA